MKRLTLLLATMLLSVSVIGCSVIGFAGHQYVRVADKLDQMRTGALTPLEAKNQMYETMRMFLNFFPGVKPVKLIFLFESCKDDNSPPFQAGIGGAIDFNGLENNPNITEMYREALTKLGWTSSNPDYHTHTLAMMFKDGMTLKLPTKPPTPQAPWGTTIDGACKVYEDPDNTKTAEELNLKLDDVTLKTGGDVTQDFLPPGVIYTPPPEVPYTPPNETTTPTTPHP